MREFQGNGKNCPPKLGGQRHRMFFAMTRGVVPTTATLRRLARNFLEVASTPPNLGGVTRLSAVSQVTA